MINQVNAQVNNIAMNAAYGTNTTATEKSSQSIGISSDVSSVVSLQGSNIQSSKVQANELNAQTAASFASDIANMLGSAGGSVQEHLNGFDAARLLAD